MPYLDYAAHAPLLPRVRTLLFELYAEGLGNPSNPSSNAGQRAKRRIEEAQGRIARLIGAEPANVVFTSGATESNNQVMLGAPAELSRSRRILVTSTDHVSVLRAGDAAAKAGIAQVDSIPVDDRGQIIESAFVHALRHGVDLVSICWVNNETGAIQNVRRVGQLVKEHGSLLHIDAAQAVGRVDMQPAWAAADFLTLSSHKLGGPSGIGALVTRHPLTPLLFGGNQNESQRPGSQPTELISAFGFACELADFEQPERIADLQAKTEYLRERLARIGAQILSPEDAAPGILSVAFLGVERDTLATLVDGVDFSIGAACSSSLEVSHVHDAMNVPPDLARGAIRLSPGNATTNEDMDEAVDAIKHVVERLAPMHTCGL